MVFCPKTSHFLITSKGKILDLIVFMADKRTTDEAGANSTTELKYQGAIRFSAVAELEPPA